MFNETELALVKAALNCLGDIQSANQGHVSEDVQALIDKLNAPAEAPKAKKVKIEEPVETPAE